MPRRNVEVEFLDLDEKPDNKPIEIDLNSDPNKVEVKPEDDKKVEVPQKEEEFVVEDDKKVEPKVEEKPDEKMQAAIDAAVQRATERQGRVHQQTMTNVIMQAQQLARENQQLRQIAPDDEEDKFEAGISSLSKQLEDAHEKGETAKAVALTNQMADLRAQFRIKQTFSRMQQPNQAPQVPQLPVSAPEATNKWLRSNSWFNDPTRAKEKNYALAIDRELVNEGFDPAADEYYAELDKRMGEAFPKLRKVEATTTTTITDDKKNERPPVAGVSRSAPSGGKPGRVTLNQEDLTIMKQFGMDTSNPDILREYARNKAAYDKGAKR